MNKLKLKEEDYIRYKIYDDKKSLTKKYADLTIGQFSYVQLIKYEFMITLLSPMPGAIGLLLRKIFYKRLFNDVGKGVVWGKSITLRYPDRIHFGNRVVIDDYALINARGSGDAGIYIGDDVIINRGVIIQSKVGAIHIGHETNIGAFTFISSQGGVIIGDYVNIAGGCHIAGGTYEVGRDSNSNREHGKYTKGPIQIDNKCRLARCVVVLDGAHIKEGTIVGAMSMVKEELPEYSVAAGIPAKVLYYRSDVDKQPRNQM